MPMQALQSADLNRDIRVALGKEPNFTEAFTQEVRALRDSISEALSATIEHDDDMNYSSAQQLIVWLDREYQPVPPHDAQAQYRVIVFVSSRGRFFAFVTLTLSFPATGWKKNGAEEPKRQWTIIPTGELPDEIASLQRRIAFVLESHRYSMLDNSTLVREANGHQTTLDNRPATVFDVLFSEVI